MSLVILAILGIGGNVLALAANMNLPGPELMDRWCGPKGGPSAQANLDRFSDSEAEPEGEEGLVSPMLELVSDRVQQRGTAAVAFVRNRKSEWRWQGKESTKFPALVPG